MKNCFSESAQHYAPRSNKARCRAPQTGVRGERTAKGGRSPTDLNG